VASLNWPEEPLTGRLHSCGVFFDECKERSNYISCTIHLHVNGKDRKNLKKRSGHLKAFCKKAAPEAYAYHRIFPFRKGIKKIWG
jgi:hypothetical protein